MRDALARRMIDLAESGRLSDHHVRLGVRAVIRRRLHREDGENPGSDYHQTLEAWLGRLDANRTEAERTLAAAGARDVSREVQAWRMFLMAWSELFAFRDGTEWAVEHCLFRHRG